MYVQKKIEQSKKKHQCEHVWRIKLRQVEVRDGVIGSSLTPGLRFTVM